MYFDVHVDMPDCRWIRVKGVHESKPISYLKDEIRRRRNVLPGKIIHLGYYLRAFTHEELEVVRLSPSNTVREAHSLILRVSDFEVSCLRNTYLLLLFKYMNTRFFQNTETTIEDIGNNVILTCKIKDGHAFSPAA